MPDKRIPELIAQPDPNGELMFAVYDPATDTTKRLKLSQFIGGYDTNSLLWDPLGVYAINDVVLSDDRFWKSLINGNIGNVPVEGANWTEVSKSLGSGLAIYSPGVYTDNPTVVLSNHGGMWQLYKLKVAAPYVSSDIVAEEVAGDWEPVPFVINIIGSIIVAGVLYVDFKGSREGVSKLVTDPAGNVSVQFLNDANARTLKLKVHINDATYILTFPASVKMADNRWTPGSKQWRASDVADADLIGDYIFEGWYDNTNWNFKVSGPYR